MEDETFGKESTLILGRPFLMMARTKIDVHAGMLSMEFGDTLVQFNIFEVMKHPTEDHSFFGIDLLDEIVEEYFQLNSSSEDIEKFAGSTNEINCLGSADEEADYEEVQNLPNFKDNHDDTADPEFEVELTKLLDQVSNQKHSECTNDAEVKVAETRSDKNRPKQAESRKRSKSTRSKSQTTRPTRSPRPSRPIETQAGVEITIPSGSDSEVA
ncbi:hypothetical protein CR513_03850, partial [Mucuna pruriens]